MDQKTNYTSSVTLLNKQRGCATYAIVYICSRVEQSEPGKGIGKCGSNLLVLPAALSEASQHRKDVVKAYSFSKTASDTAWLPALQKHRIRHSSGVISIREKQLSTSGSR